MLDLEDELEDIGLWIILGDRFTGSWYEFHVVWVDWLCSLLVWRWELRRVDEDDVV